MSSFILDGVTYEYLRPDPGPTEHIRSWEYGKYPKIMVTLPLAGGATDPYARANRWNPSHILDLGTTTTTTDTGRGSRPATWLFTVHGEVNSLMSVMPPSGRHFS
jgi:hypothetical protein